MISMRFRRLYRRLSYLTGVLRCIRPGTQARIIAARSKAKTKLSSYAFRMSAITAMKGQIWASLSPGVDR